MPQTWLARLKTGEALVGIGTIAVALVLMLQARQIPGEGVGSSVGPNVGPWFVAILLGVLGTALVIETLLRQEGTAQDAEQHDAVDRRSAGWMLLGLFLNVALIEVAGFIIASTLMFLCIARAFGSERILRDGAIGFALAFVAYVGFDRLLGYKIGSGLIERLI